MTKRSKEFIPGRGYTREDWDAVDSPELTKEEIASLRPAREVMPPELFEALTKRNPGQRGPQKAPTKAFISLRIDQDILERFKADGPGWQSRINDALRKSIVG
jgi:uncharacterized protein (DUF4415 family)